MAAFPLNFRIEINWACYQHSHNAHVSLEFQEILSQNLKDFHWLGVSGMLKIMHCGILINMPYWFQQIIFCWKITGTTYLCWICTNSQSESCLWWHMWNVVLHIPVVVALEIVFCIEIQCSQTVARSSTRYFSVIPSTSLQVRKN